MIWGENPYFRKHPYRIIVVLILKPTRYSFELTEHLALNSQQWTIVSLKKWTLVSKAWSSEFSPENHVEGIYMGVSLNGGFPPISHPKMTIFSRKTPWLLGKPTILGNPQAPNHAPIVLRKALSRLEESSLSKCKLVRRALGFSQVFPGEWQIPLEKERMVAAMKQYVNPKLKEV